MLEKREEYSEEFIDLLYNYEDKERARNKTLLATEHVPRRIQETDKQSLHDNEA